jgi:23S rRNA (guanosine2251-2'-O)-methyltransferase
MTLTLRNPHSVAAALQHRPHDVLEIHIAPSRPSEGWERVVEEARRLGIPIRTDLTAPPARGRGDKSARESAAGAVVRERTGVPLDQLWTESAPQIGDVWLALDCLQDPHNVGAIFRSAAFFGVRGMIITRDRSAPLSGTVYDVAAGGVEGIPFASVPNLAAAMKQARDAGLWLLGSSERADKPLSAVPRDRPWLLIVGNEEHGLRRLTFEHCDEVCRITASGSVGSLNVSVATGVLLAGLRGELPSR